jgi:alpha-N-arabinofuranosidase
MPGYRNPILPGFHADPSIVRAGNDYYLVTSSFEYFPGVPVYRSRDLVSWKQVGNALTRESQLKLAGQKSSKGIFAPAIRHHDGTFYMVTTNIENGGSFYVTTKDPAGEWSDPIFVGEKGFSMDPSLFFDDDGKVYYTRHGGGRNGGVYQSEIDLATGALREEPKLVWSGTGGIWPEGPHLYKVNGTYYLMISEGGTSYNHSLTIARSKSPWGPFESNPANPILTHRDKPEQPLQALGHGDLVQTPGGDWFVVFLGIRPWYRHHHIGRETMLAPVTWDANGWPHVNGDKAITKKMSVETLPRSSPFPKDPVRTEFDGPALGPQWVHLRTPSTDRWSLTERKGYLRLKGNRETLDETGSPAFVARRQEHFRARVTAKLEFSPAVEGEVAGLVLRQGDRDHYEIRISGTRLRKLEVVSTTGAIYERKYAEAIGNGSVTLHIEAFRDGYAFGFAENDGLVKVVARLPAEPLSSENAAGAFTGVFIGMYAYTTAGDTMPPADFAWFAYEPLEQPLEE